MVDNCDKQKSYAKVTDENTASSSLRTLTGSTQKQPISK